MLNESLRVLHPLAERSNAALLPDGLEGPVFRVRGAIPSKMERLAACLAACLPQKFLSGTDAAERSFFERASRQSIPARRSLLRAARAETQAGHDGHFGDRSPIHGTVRTAPTGRSAQDPFASLGA